MASCLPPDDDDDDSPVWTILQTLFEVLPEADPTYLIQTARKLTVFEVNEFIAEALETNVYPRKTDSRPPQQRNVSARRLKPPSNNKDGQGLVQRMVQVMEQRMSGAEQSAEQVTEHRMPKTQHSVRPTKNNKSPALVRLNRLEDQLRKIIIRRENLGLEEVPVLNGVKDHDNNNFVECKCCFDEEVRNEQSSTCDKGHRFCNECVNRYVESQIGQGIYSFPCFVNEDDGCKGEFKLSVLKTFLDPNTCSRIEKQRQLDEILSADMDGLVRCPFCEYCCILPAEDNLFYCENQACLKVTCKHCGKFHVSERCDDTENDDEIQVRTYIEDKMTEALVRVCWQCKAKFVKEDGCNKMTCKCGAYMCYVCKKPVQGYDHFSDEDDGNKCPLYSDFRALEQEEVRQGGQQAKTEMKTLNPNVKLRYDPTDKM